MLKRMVIRRFHRRSYRGFYWWCDDGALTSDILDTAKFWSDEIMKVNDEFLFGHATGDSENWQGTNDFTFLMTVLSPFVACSLTTVSKSSKIA